MATAKYRVELAKGKHLEFEVTVPYAQDEEAFRDNLVDAKLAGHNGTLAEAVIEWFVDQAELSEVVEFDPPDYDDE